MQDEEWAPLELVDVVELASGKVTHQLYVWPYGSGQLFEHDKLTPVAMIIQHGFDMDPEQDDLAFRKALAAAYATAEPKLSEHVDFKLDQVSKKATPSESAERAIQKAAIERLRKELGYSKERYRLFDALTKAQQAAVREEYPHLYPYESFHHFENLGIPPYVALGRWAGIDASTPLEQGAPHTRGAWPVWKWLKAAQTKEIDVAKCSAALNKHLPPPTIMAIVWYVTTTVVAGVSPYELWARELDSDRAKNEAAVHMIRLLAAIVDGSGDDAAVELAERAEKHLAKEPTFYLAAVATFALAVRARRRGEPFPTRFYKLAAGANFLGNGSNLRDAIREIFELIPMAERERFLVLYGMYFTAITDEEIVKGRTREVPVLIHAWCVADLVPTEKVAKGLVEDMATWNNYPKPKQAALDIVKKVGPICVPYLETALKTSTSKHKDVLAKALALFAAAPAKATASRSRSGRRGSARG